MPYKDKVTASQNIQLHRDKAQSIVRRIRQENLEGSSMMHFLAHHDAQLSEMEIVDELLSLTAAGHESKE